MTRAGPKVDRCELCGGEEPRTSKALIAPCDCYKKFEDRGKMHPDCLRDHLAHLAMQGDSVDTQCCPRCGKAYRINMFATFVCDCAHLCRGKALNNAFELCIVAFTFLCTAFSFFLLDWEEVARDATTFYLLICMSLATVVMVIFTLRKVFRRFKASSSDIIIAEV